MKVNGIRRDRIKAFNTGNAYSEKGQRIAYAFTQDSLVFIDVDRSIGGEIHPYYLKHRDVWPLEKSLMYAYNNGDYSYYPVYSGVGSDSEALTNAAEEL